MTDKIPDAHAAELLTLRRAVEASGEVIFMTDREGLFTYVNPAFVALYGFTPDELIGCRTPRVLKARQLDEVRYEEFWRRLLQGETLQGAFVNRAKSGQLVEVEASVSPILDDSGRIAGFLAIQRDVTARRQADRQLQRWAEIFEHTAVGVAVADAVDTTFSLVNPAFARMHGYAVDELVGAPISTVYPPGRASAEIAGHARQLEKTGRVSALVTHRRRDGTTFPAAIELNAVRDDTGRILYRIATVVDVTDRQTREAAVRESEAKYQALYASMREGVALHELVRDEAGRPADYRLIDVNPAFERHTGIPPARAVGSLGSELYGTGEAPYLDVYAAVVESGKATTFEVGFDPLDRIFQVSAFPVDGDRFATIFEDVTDRRQLEEQFRQAQKMEAVGRLAGGIAHDFNNLLTAILGYCELLRQQPLPAAAQTDLAEIHNAGSAAASLTRQLLAFSRRQVLRAESVDLNAIVGEIDSMLRRVIGEDVRLVTIPAAGLWRITADPGQMQQVLLNLAVNARDAMPRGGSLIVETANVTVGEATWQPGGPPPGRYVALIVSDNGIGMSAETQTRMFEPFFTTKEPGKGTGLGLSTVYGIVKQSAGHILVQSEPGRGATFRILMPAGADQAIGRPAARPGAIAAGSETVLVVEEQAPVRNLIVTVLQGLGYSVLQAPDALRAEAEATRHAGGIDLLLTSMQPGPVSGPALAQRLVADRPRMRVLCISGHADQATLVGVMSSRMAFLHKPFTPAVLGETVRQVLDGTAG